MTLSLLLPISFDPIAINVILEVSGIQYYQRYFLRPSAFDVGEPSSH